MSDNTLTPSLTLSVGNHRCRADGLCLMEAVAYMAGERHSDHPECVSPLLGALGRSLNDGLFREHLQQLAPYVPRLLHTNTLGLERYRAYLATDWAVRGLAPRILIAYHQPTDAARLRALSPITDEQTSADAASALRGMQEYCALQVVRELVQALRAFTGRNDHGHIGTYSGEVGSKVSSTAHLAASFCSGRRGADEIRAEALCLLDRLLEETV